MKFGDRMKSVMKVSGVAAVALAASTALANPPTSYEAHTDLNYYNNPYPALPNWGGQVGANTIIKDPALGCPILRVTDANTEATSGVKFQRPFTTDSSSESRTWNTTSTIFWVEDAEGAGRVAFNLNKTTFQVTKNANAMPELNDFSGTNPNICYAKNGTQLLSYDFSTNVSTLIVDAASYITQLPNRLGSMHVSRNGVICVIAGGMEQGKDTKVFVYNTNNGTHHLLDLTTNPCTLDGVTVTTITPGTLHNASIDPSGRYISLDPQNGGFIISIYDINTSTVYPISVENNGHKVFGYGASGLPAFVNTDASQVQTVPPHGAKNDTWLMRSPSSSGVSTFIDLVEHPASDGKYFAYDNHVSWNNSIVNGQYPVFSDTYHVQGVADPLCVWGDEIVAMGTSATSNNTVWRFAQHRSVQNNYGTLSNPVINFYDTPRGNISQDGMYFMFTSNYGDTLGTYPTTGRYREDVFVVHLDQTATK